MNNMVIQGYTKLLGVRAQMCGWIKKSPALRVQCGPFIPLLIISATVWLGDFLMAIYILIGPYMHFQLKRYS